MSRISFNAKQARDLHVALQWGISEVGNRMAQEDFYDFEYPDEPTEDEKEMKRLRKIDQRLKTFLKKQGLPVLEWD